MINLQNRSPLITNIFYQKFSPSFAKINFTLMASNEILANDQIKLTVEDIKQSVKTSSTKRQWACNF